MTKKIDKDVYDSIPETSPENYIQGFLVIIYVPYTMIKRGMQKLTRVISSTNPYAVIVPDFKAPEDEEYPYSVIYLINKTEFEHLHAVCKLDRLSDVANIKIDYEFRKPVWFHKGNINQDYDPNFMSTYTQKLDALNHFSTLSLSSSLLSEEEQEEIRFKANREKPCYEKREQDKYCTIKHSRNRQICARCSCWHLHKNYNKQGQKKATHQG